MINKTIIAALTFITIVTGLGNNIVLAKEELRYALCQDNIKSVFINSHEDNVTLNIQLTESATKEFSELTGNNIKSILTILLNDQVIISTIIHAQIDSGVMGPNVESLDEAEELKQSILNNAPESPCGLIQ
jgi:preprotein translocase subunit SecD